MTVQEYRDKLGENYGQLAQSRGWSRGDSESGFLTGADAFIEHIEKLEKALEQIKTNICRDCSCDMLAEYALDDLPWRKT